MFSKNHRTSAGFGPILSAGSLAISISFGFCPAAHAQASAGVPETASPLGRARESSAAETTRWYGYQPAIADAVAIGSIFGAAATLCLSLSDTPPRCSQAPSTMFLATAAVSYFAAAPAIHLAHGHWDKAGLSLGIRVVPVLLTAALSSTRERGSSTPDAVAFFGAAATAMVIDDVFIASETVPRSASSSWYVAPAVDPKQHAASLTIGGLF